MKIRLELAALAASVFLVPWALFPIPESPIHISAPEPVSILFLGDVMLDRYIRAAAARSGYEYVFRNLRPLMASNDITVFNLEGTVTDRPSVSEGSVPGTPANYIFTFKPAAVETFASAGRVIASLGNNHVDDLGIEGMRETEAHLNRLGIRFFGSPLAVRAPLIMETRQGSVALVSYNEFKPESAENTEGALAAVADLNAREPRPFVVVFAHWGEEYATTTPPRVRMLARSFVDAGADLVIGTHPHVVEPPEEYKNVPIYYSLGNAVFDQYWSKEVRCGLALSITLERGVLRHVEPIPLYLGGGREHFRGGGGNQLRCPLSVVQWLRSQ